MPSDNLSQLSSLAEELMKHLADARRLHAAGHHREAERAREKSGTIMASGPLVRWLMSKFQRRGIPQERCEDLVMDVWRKLLQGDYDVRASAIGFLASMARTRLLDFLRARAGTEEDPALRAGQGTAADDDDGQAWDAMFDTLAGGYEINFALIGCVQRKLAEMALASATSANKVELLMMVAEGLSRREMASVVFGKPQHLVTEKNEGAIRDRVYQARKLAKKHFKECLE